MTLAAFILKMSVAVVDQSIFHLRWDANPTKRQRAKQAPPTTDPRTAVGWSLVVVAVLLDLEHYR